MLKILKFNEYLNESISQDIYHYTTPQRLYSILKQNRFVLSNWLGNNTEVDRVKELYYLSTTRLSSFDVGFTADVNSNIIRIVFDTKKVTQRYKILPFNYFQTREYNIEIPKRNYKIEGEERIVSNNPYIIPANRYIQKIEIIKLYEVYFKQLIPLMDDLGIQYDLYASKKDYDKGIKMDTPPFYDTDYDVIDTDKHIFPDNNSTRIVPLIFTNEILLNKKNYHLYTDVDANNKEAISKINDIITAKVKELNFQMKVDDLVVLTDDVVNVRLLINELKSKYIFWFKNLGFNMSTNIGKYLSSVISKFKRLNNTDFPVFSNETFLNLCERIRNKKSTK